MFTLNVSSLANVVFQSLNSSGSVIGNITVSNSAQDANYLYFNLTEWCSGGINPCPANSIDLMF